MKDFFINCNVVSKINPPKCSGTYLCFGSVDGKKWANVMVYDKETDTWRDTGATDKQSDDFALIGFEKYYPFELV